MLPTSTNVAATKTGESVEGGLHDALSLRVGGGKSAYLAEDGEAVEENIVVHDLALANLQEVNRVDCEGFPRCD